MLVLKKGTLTLALAAALGALVQPGPEAAGQAALGTQLSTTEYAADQSSWGPGVRALLKMPFTGLTFQGTYDSFRMPCGPETCWQRDVGLAILRSLPLPLPAEPYLGLGVSPKLEDSWKLSWDVGSTDLYALAGLWLGGSGFLATRFFAEAKHSLRGSRLSLSTGFLLFLF